MGTGNDNDRYVVEHDDGWAVVKEEHERASAVFPTQAEAIDRAREIIRNAGGGELVVRGRDGKIRQKDTVAAAPSGSHATSSEPAEPTTSSSPAAFTADAAPETFAPPAAPAAVPTPAAPQEPPAAAASDEGTSSAASEGRFAGFVRKLRGG